MIGITDFSNISAGCDLEDQDPCKSSSKRRRREEMNSIENDCKSLHLDAIFRSLTSEAEETTFPVFSLKSLENVEEKQEDKNEIKKFDPLKTTSTGMKRSRTRSLSRSLSFRRDLSKIEIQNTSSSLTYASDLMISKNEEQQESSLIPKY